MSCAGVQTVAPEMPHGALPDADWGDAYAIRMQAKGWTVRQVAEKAIGPMPGWARWLLFVRNLVVSPFGLRPAAAGEGDRIGPFPVVSSTEREIVLGFDDRHLDFRIVISLSAAGSPASSIRAMTLIRRHNVWGRLYLLSVLPFHKLIVRSMLASLRDKQQETS